MVKTVSGSITILLRLLSVICVKPVSANRFPARTNLPAMSGGTSLSTVKLPGHAGAVSSTLIFVELIVMEPPFTFPFTSARAYPRKSPSSMMFDP